MVVVSSMGSSCHLSALRRLDAPRQTHLPDSGECLTTGLWKAAHMAARAQTSQGKLCHAVAAPKVGKSAETYRLSS